MLQHLSPRKWHGVPGFISCRSTTPATQPSQHAVHSPHWRIGAAAIGIVAPQHFLYFLPLPQGQGSLRPTGMESEARIRIRPVYFAAKEELCSSIRNTAKLVVYLAVLLSLLQGVSMRGAKMVVSLSALAGGATPFQVGLLAALFAAFPLLLAVYAGRLSDRIGVKPLLFFGSFMMALGILVPLALGGLAGLMLCATLIGLGHIFFHVSIHNFIGAY